MKYLAKTPAVLLLEDGKVFRGKAAGKIGTTTGEICFNTGMTGYQEIFTDPSYFGQIMVTTNVHIGNYGISKDETESKSIKIAGLVCKSFNETYSRKRAASSIKDYFLNDSIVAISDVDTRALVRYIRDKGAMNAIISSEEIKPNCFNGLLSELSFIFFPTVQIKTSSRVSELIASASSGIPFLGLATSLATKRTTFFFSSICFWR